MLQPKHGDDPERRKDPRQPFSRYVFYATAHHFYEGDLVNFSRGGICIQSSEIPPVGEMVTVALPYSEEKNDKRKGQVVWTDHEEFGVEFFKDPSERVTRLQAI